MACRDEHPHTYTIVSLELLQGDPVVYTVERNVRSEMIRKSVEEKRNILQEVISAIE